VDTLWQDVRHAARSLRKSPGFTFVVVATLALGIGANSLIFSIVNAIMLRPMPLPRAERVMQIEQTLAARGARDLDLSYPDFLDLRERSRTFEGFGAMIETSAYLSLGGEPERFLASLVTSGLFPALGVTPLLGRNFTTEEEQPGKNLASVIVSHRIWRDRLGADPGALGRTLRMNGRVRTIVGVMPAGFRFPETVDFWAPLALERDAENRGDRFLGVFGRMRPGVTVEKARAELNGIAAALEREHPETNRGVGFHVEQVQSRWARDIKPMMIVLMAAVGFVLLIACANVANLMLARAATRQREIGVRLALGAGRGRVARQLLTESVLLAVAGGVVGIVLAQWGIDLVLASIPIELPYFLRIEVDRTVLGFTAAVAVASGILFGLAPLLHVSETNLQHALKEGDWRGSAGRAGNRTRNALVVAELALALVLLAGAGLMIRSFQRMQEIRSGLEPEGVYTGAVTLPVAVYPDDEARRRFFRRLLDEAAALPGARSAALTTGLPLQRGSWGRDYALEDTPLGDPSTLMHSFFALVTPGYFGTLGIPIRKGRDFEWTDGADSPPVIIVSESLARRSWPGQDPLGQRVGLVAGNDSLAWHRVVGVVGDARPRAASPGSEMIYAPHPQSQFQTMTLVVKTDREAAALAQPLRRLVQSLDRDMPLYDARTLRQALGRALWEERIYAGLLTSFAVVALLMAAVGIYGVMAYSVAQRTHEIGIRMALGARQGSVLRLVVGRALSLTVLGLGIGLAIAFAATRLMASLLFGVSASDPPTFLGVTLILAGSALLASSVPAIRATRVDPIVALRHE
jgi:putative ABC transport system permease protein